MIFKHKFEAGLKDINEKNEIKSKAILEMLENIAEKHSYSIGEGLNSVKKTGLTWMLLDWKVKMLKNPCYGDELELKTWSREAKKFYAYRDFEIYVNGEKVGIASSNWILIDIYNQRPARITDDFINKYEPEIDMKVFEEDNIEKMRELEEYEKVIEYKVRKSDIDINGHMHNLNYLDVVSEAIDDEDCNKSFKNIRVTYKKEIKLGEIVKCYSKKIDGAYYFAIKSYDDLVVHALIELS